MSNTSDLPQGIPVQAPNPNSGKIYRAFIGWPPNLPGYPRTMTTEPDRPRRDVSIEEAERMPMSDEELDAIEAIARRQRTHREYNEVILDLVAEVRRLREYETAYHVCTKARDEDHAWLKKYEEELRRN